MTVYSVNLGIGWASSGVEYAQAYRAQVLRKLGIKAKFIFVDYIQNENIANLTANIGLNDEEVIWAYNFFSDLPLKKPSISLTDFKDGLGQKVVAEKLQGSMLILKLAEGIELRVHLTRYNPTIVNRVEYIVGGKLVKQAYYTSSLSHEEFYTEGKLNLRRFYNQDGSVALEEFITDNKATLYKTQQQVFYSKEELLVAFMKKLSLKATDIVLLDRETGLGQIIFENVKPAKLGVVVHAEHFSENETTADYILWNNYYDYQFTNAKWVDFYITATEAQKNLLVQQLQQYNHQQAEIYVIPVGSLVRLQKTRKPRKMYSLMTASRLANEKHLDWVIAAVVAARKLLPELTLDIYGAGALKDKLNTEIKQANAQDYIRLMGHQDLSDVYLNYEAYISASTSEGFGLTLLEAIGSGLPLIGLDVRYGNQTFIDDGQNGYLLTLDSYQDRKVVVQALVQAIIKLFTEADLAEFSQHSYEKAQAYLDDSVETRWQELVLKEVGRVND